MFTTGALGQQCQCITDSSLSEAVTCYTVRFSNHAKLYRQFNCDSSWLTFESSRGTKTILYSLDDGLIGYTEKLGYQYATEYKATFLVQNNLISGCCTPPEYLLFNKSTGKVIKNLGRLIFYSEDVKFPLVVYIEDTVFSRLKFYDVNTGRLFYVPLPPHTIKNTLEKGAERYAEYLFEDAEISGNHFSVSFRYQNPGNNDDWMDYKLSVDLKKYGY